MRAIVVGAGPVGCLLAVGLRRCGLDVEMHERDDDPRASRVPHGRSYNLTLSPRALRALGAELAERQYRDGVRLPVRVRHHADGSLSSEPYGVAAEHHLLSIPRSALHASLVEAAERAGARLHFRRRCVMVDPSRGRAAFDGEGGTVESAADLVAGCDGAHSIVRQELVRRGALALARERIRHAYIEIAMPVAGGEHPLALAARRATRGASADAFHIWPRGTFMLVAQPNRDGSHTATLFLPRRTDGAGGPSFEELGAPAHVERFLARHFPDVAPCAPPPAAEPGAVRPARLATRICDAFHHERAALFGDAAHTMLPFYGQGINCSFEDVDVFLGLLARRLARGGGDAAIRASLEEYTATRRSPCGAIAALSRARLDELLADSRDERALARADLERTLYQRDPAGFAPLYASVAFSATPYDVAIAEYRRRRRRLDDLCRRFDARTERDRIIAAYTGAA
jgi:2-polyprenyl-6-methoxyphenol hydroxylase-like FAD-dependent oxidoreductase